MIGKTILHFTPWDKSVRLLGFHFQKAKIANIRIHSNALSNGVNKIIAKTGRRRHGRCLLIFFHFYGTFRKHFRTQIAPGKNKKDFKYYKNNYSKKEHRWPPV